MKYRLSKLALLNSCLLGLVAISLSVSSWWGMSALKKPYIDMGELTALSNDIRRTVLSPLELYLEKGDALLLNQAEEGIERTLEQMANTHSEESILLGQKLATLKEFLKLDVRAAGKLSGNPLGLLIQNERETRDNLSLLIRYALEGYKNNAQSATEFIKRSTGLLEMLHQLALIRERFFSSLSQVDFELIREMNAEADSEIKALNQLSLLGVYNEKDQGFEFMLGGASEEKEDKAVSYLSELSSLVNRYIHEIENTQQNLKRISETSNDLANQINTIDDLFEEMKKTINNEIDQSFDLVTTILSTTVFLILVVALFIDLLQRNMIKRINSLVPHLREYALGNFTHAVTVSSFIDEIQVLCDSSNRLREYMIKLVSEVKERTGLVQNISKEFSVLATNLSEESNEQQTETSKISVSIGQMNISFNDVAERAGGAAEQALRVEAAVHNGNALVQSSITNVTHLVKEVKETTESVKLLSSEAENIGSVLTVIETIAKQTNLLALNAAIEAARAGEQGRGFAVVADEVRSLSVRTSESTQEINGIIERLQASARNTVNVMEKHSRVAQKAADEAEVAGARLSEISKAITQIKDLNDQIAVTTEEQAAVANDISRNINQITDVSARTASRAGEGKQKSLQLNRLSNTLQEAVEQFKI